MLKKNSWDLSQVLYIRSKRPRDLTVVKNASPLTLVFHFATTIFIIFPLHQTQAHPKGTSYSSPWKTLAVETYESSVICNNVDETGGHYTR